MTLKQPGIFIVGVNPKLANLTDVQVEVDAAKFFGPDDNDFGIMCRTYPAMAAYRPGY